MGNGLRISTGSADITPHAAIPLAGWAGRDGDLEAVGDPLEINAVLLDDGGASVLLVSVDTLYVGRPLATALRETLDSIGRPDCAVFAGASHTHFAPSCDPDKPALGTADPTYCAEVERAATTLVAELCSRPLEAAQLSHGTASAEHSINRRRRVGQRIEMRANPRGPTLETVDVIRLEAKERVIIWSYACHPVGYPHAMHVSADFPGAVRARLREQLGESTRVLFFQGFSGDTRPRALAPIGRHPRRVADALFRGRGLGQFSEESYRQWTASLAAVVSDVRLVESTPRVAVATAERPLSDIIPEELSGRPLTMTRIDVAPGLQLLGVNAEVVARYGDLAAAIMPRARTIPVGCIGETFGYLPTAQMGAEGGYEGGEFFPFFGLHGRFSPSVEETTLSLMRAVLTQSPDEAHSLGTWAIKP